jgi:hypothetical protein
MPSLTFGIRLFAAAAIGAFAIPTLATPVLAQSDIVWVSVSQGDELLATAAAKPLGELRREDILVSFKGTLAPGSMAPTVTRVQQTAVRVPATPLDLNVPLTVNGFMLRYSRANGTAYITVSSIAGGPTTGERETPMTTFALAPGESHVLDEARPFGAAPITISASSAPATLASHHVGTR